MAPTTKPRPLKAASSQPRVGRPPNAPRTSLGRYMQARSITAKVLVAAMLEHAPRCGIDREHVPSEKKLRDYVNGRYAPPAPVMLLVLYATGGNVGLEHWVRDLF